MREGARQRAPQLRAARVAPGVPRTRGCPSSASGSWACSRASSAPFTWQVLGKLKSSVWDVIGERDGGRAGVEKNAVSIAPERGRAPARKQPPEPGSRGGVPPRPPSGAAQEMGGCQTWASGPDSGCRVEDALKEVFPIVTSPWLL